jgi:hypothetical protein
MGILVEYLLLNASDLLDLRCVDWINVIAFSAFGVDPTKLHACVTKVHACMQRFKEREIINHIMLSDDKDEK